MARATAAMGDAGRAWAAPARGAGCARSRRAAGAIRRRCSAWRRWQRRATSGDLAEQAIGHLARQPRAVLMRLEKADQRLMHRLGLLAEIVEVEAGQGRGPVERL